MPRQILTLPDLPPALLTDSEGTAAYASVDHTHPQVTTGEYHFQTNPAMTDPGTGNFRSNTGAAATATSLAMDQQGAGGTDITSLFLTMRLNDTIFVQDKNDALQWVRYQLTASATMNSGWAQVPVSVISSGGTIAGSQLCVMQLTLTAGGGGGGGSGVVGTDALWDAKGDLAAGSGANAAARLPLGTDGHVLTADSAQTLGVKWAAAAGGGAFVDEAGDTMTGLLNLHGAAATTNVFQAKLVADTQPRFRVDASGFLEWGPGGSTVPDTSIKRTATDQLTFDADLLPTPSGQKDLGTATAQWRDVQASRNVIIGATTSTLQIGGSTTASAGTVRLRNASTISWRNAGNTTNLTLAVDASDNLTSSAPVFPSATNTLDLGATGTRWRKLWAVDGEFTNAPTVGGVALPLASALAAYLPLAGGNLTGPLTFGGDATLSRTGAGALRADKNFGVQVNPSAWHIDTSAFQVGTSGAVWGVNNNPGLYFTSNTYYDGNRKSIANGAGVAAIEMTFGAAFEPAPLVIKTAPAPTAGGQGQTFTNRVLLSATGLLTLTPDSNTTALVTSGHVGVGTTPQVWNGGRKAVQVGDAAAVWGFVGGQGARFTSNTYLDASAVHRAIVAGEGSIYEMYGGTHSFRSAPNVAAGATQTFTERAFMSIDGTLSLTPAGSTPGLAVGPGVTPAAYVRATVQVGQAGAITAGTSSADIQFTCNNRFDGANNLAVVAGPGSFIGLGGGAMNVWTAPTAAAGGVQSFTKRFEVTGTGDAVLISPAALSLSAATSMYVTTAAGYYILPGADNATHFGHPSYRFMDVYAVAGAINTSSQEYKQNFTLLDPAACATAVLETDWVDFDYKPPVFTEPDPQDDEEPQARSARVSEARANHARVLEETAHTRKQRGYVLQSPDHRVSDLFGLSDRKSASVGSDLAVVAAALQNALTRIAALEGATA